MSHPANPRNEWYLREFGLMIVSAAQSEPVRITTEFPFQYAARFLAHDGELSSGLALLSDSDLVCRVADNIREPPIVQPARVQNGVQIVC